MADIEKSIESLSIKVKEVQLAIGKMYAEGKTAAQVFSNVNDRFQDLNKEAVKLAKESEKAFSSKDTKAYEKAITEITLLLGKLKSSYASIDVAVKKNEKAVLSADKAKSSSTKNLQKEYESGFQKLLEGERKLIKLQEDISLKNIQLSKKANVDKLQDVVNYYTRLQSEYKEDSEEYLKIEKKKLDAQIKLQKESDSIRLNKKKAAVEQAVKLEKKTQEQQKALRDRISERNKARTKEVIDFEKKQAERRARVLTSIEKKKEKQRTAAVKKGVNERQAAEKKSANSIGSRLKKAAGTLGIYGAAYKVINSATRIFTELTVGSAKAAIEFQQALASLGAVAGATSKEVEILGKNALSVAGSTKFTAIEIVSLQTELSKLGFTADEVVASTQAIAFTAQALSAPLDEVANQTGKVINQFDLLIEQAGFVGDVLVTAINNSALSFDSFGTAIQYVGPIAKNLGLTFEQTAGAMAVLADNGFTASRIGTGLRGILTELGKTSADVESSLKSLAGQNISLSEAVDLVGKRNAAQLITLLKNIDAIDEGNKKYYQQGRALQSAAKDVDSFAGQMKLLNSAFVQFQINVGDSIANSDVLLSILDAFFPAAGKTARGFKAINEVGFEAFNEGAKDVEKGAGSLNKTLELLGISQEEYNQSLVALSRTETSFLDYLPDGFSKLGDAALAQVNKVEGFKIKLEELAEESRVQTLITQGQTTATNEYEESVRTLTQAFEDQVNVNKEVDATAERINSQIDEYASVIKTGMKTETDAFGIRSKMVKATEDEILRYKGLVGALKGYLDQLTNISFSEDELNRKRESEQSKLLRVDIRNIKDRNQKAIDAINERAKNETSISKSADDRADIEMKRTATISNLYKKQSAEIRDLSKEYDTQKDKIEKLAGASDELAEILTSDVIEDVTKTVKDYASEIVKLDKLAESSQLTQEEYNKARADQEVALRANIAAFSALADLNPEVKAFFDQLIDDTVNADYALSNLDGVTKLPKNLKEQLTDGFNEIDWGQVILEAAQTASEALSEFNDVALENAKGEAEQQLDVIKNRYEVEGEILKSQLDNQLITEGQFRQKKKELRKAQLRDENEIDKAVFDAQKKRDRQDATSNYLMALANIVPALITKDNEANPVALAIKAAITGALATVSYGASLGAINKRQFFPKTFADGGMVNGPAHSEGGVPFSVQGREGYEMEGGEYIVNKKATSMHRDLLDRINGSQKSNGSSSNIKFADGGIVNSLANANMNPNISLINSQPVSVSIEKESDESVDYLKAIAEATSSTAIGVSKPVRAFVSDKDLRTDSNERRIRNRNDRV